MSITIFHPEKTEDFVGDTSPVKERRYPYHSRFFSAARYGDMHAFIQELKKVGFRETRLIPATEGLFMSHIESVWMRLGGPAFFGGRK